MTDQEDIGPTATLIVSLWFGLSLADALPPPTRMLPDPVFSGGLAG